mmetsp:Transcript_67542/g.162152  ORF Transcript_67542/g.162152 Transcript_67542/m.162152 type:complete len:100 (-) Transcript_67542:58-357(-)
MFSSHGFLCLQTASRRPAVKKQVTCNGHSTHHGHKFCHQPPPSSSSGVLEAHRPLPPVKPDASLNWSVFSRALQYRAYGATRRIGTLKGVTKYHGSKHL